ncbi:ArfGEF [Acrasis kona]|uniref:ArfGEF n=1 Tax=Acrasis kona TaxID=1008807 RepID=A0AAW2YX59_9EUKA
MTRFIEFESTQQTIHHVMSQEKGISSRRLILSEVDSLVIGLRTNSRFSNRARFVRFAFEQYEIPRTNENPLMIELKELRDKLSTQSGWEGLNLMDVLTPFFSIIKSEDTTGPITAVALQSIQKFLDHPVITSKTQGAKLALSEIIHAVQHCQFEVTDAQTDEAVLIKILQLFTTCVRSDCGLLLDQKDLVEVIKSCFRIGRETRPTEILRRSAEDALMVITQAVFKRVRDDPQSVDMHMVFEFICDLCDPEKQGKSASCRLLGLSLASNMLEIMGTQLSLHESLLHMAQDSLARALLRNSVTSNIVVLSQTLRGMTNLIACATPHLHEQIEQFIVCTHLRIADSKHSSFEHQELVLESLIELCRDQSLLTFLYKHYDCNPHSSNLFENICKFFSKNLKESETLHTIHVLSLQGLLSIVKCVSERCQQESVPSPPPSPSPSPSPTSPQLDHIRSIKEQKRKMMDVVENFNIGYKKGINTMMQLGFLQETDTLEQRASCIAKFMHDHAAWLSKREMGIVIRSDGPLNRLTLKEYMDRIDLTNLTIDDAVRYVVQKFELNGESQQVERQLVQFGATYHHYNPNHKYIESAETAYIFIVAITVLNTDLHNLMSREKMSLDKWLQLCNDMMPHMKDKQELERIYNNIMRNQLQSNTNNMESYKSDAMWDDLLTKSRQYPIAHAQQQELLNQVNVDVDMFQTMWGHTIMATSIVLENTEDVDVLEMSVKGFLDSAGIAAHYKLSNVFDNLVITLCKFTRILSVDHAISAFGHNDKTQMACRTVFAITRNYGDNLREGWQNILDLILNMYQLDLLPSQITDRNNAFSIKSNQHGHNKHNKTKLKNQNSNTYLFGFFGSNDDSIQEKQGVERAKACIEQCRIPELLLKAKILNLSSLEYLMNAITKSTTSTSQQQLDTCLFCLDLLTDIVCCNKDSPHDRIVKILRYVHNHMMQMYSNKAQQQLVDKVMCCMLNICVELMTCRSDLNDIMMESLKSILIVDQIKSLPSLMNGLEALVNQVGHELSAPIMNQLLTCLSCVESNDQSIALCNSIVEKHMVRLLPHSMLQCVKCVLHLMSDRIQGQRCMVALHQLCDAEAAARDPDWNRAWICALSGLARLCTSSNKDVRGENIVTLQRILINPDQPLPSSLLINCLNQVLFVLLDDLLNQHYKKQIDEQQQQPDGTGNDSHVVYYQLNNKKQIRLDHSTLEELRFRVCGLFVRVYLHYVQTHAQPTPELPSLWEKVMDYMHKYMSISNNEYLTDAMPEHLKNMILVMNNSQIFTRDELLWRKTQDKLNLFVPKLILDLKSVVEHNHHVDQVAAAAATQEEGEIPNTTNTTTTATIQ